MTIHLNFSSLKELSYRYGSQVDQLEDIFSQNTSKNQRMKRIAEIGQRSLDSLKQYWSAIYNNNNNNHDWFTLTGIHDSW